MKESLSNDDYRKYRWFLTSSGKLVVGGKSDSQNELIIKNFLEERYRVMHTSKPGSGFMILVSEKWARKDLEEMAVFCGCFSKQWKLSVKGKKISVDMFEGSDVFKKKGMKTGTFGVDGKKENFMVVPELVLVKQKGLLRAVPKWKGMTRKDYYLGIGVGRMGKEEAVDVIVEKLMKRRVKVSKDEVLSAIPSDRLGIK
jgi:hypothetical protein|tara:strand:- start:517 stop:1113 length:597 start_codon:yes stop_codon:yes gene_type:complete